MQYRTAVLIIYTDPSPADQAAQPGDVDRGGLSGTSEQQRSNQFAPRLLLSKERAGRSMNGVVWSHPKGWPPLKK